MFCLLFCFFSRAKSLFIFCKLKEIQVGRKKSPAAFVWYLQSCNSHTDSICLAAHYDFERAKNNTLSQAAALCKVQQCRHIKPIHLQPPCTYKHEHFHQRTNSHMPNCTRLLSQNELLELN
uniref:Putative secreted protein n=1 Tax=Rhipicephalus microplus TaxID=6941 RepID=A0A6M2DCK4_RHIMP